MLGVRYNEHRNDFHIPEALECPIIGLTPSSIAVKSHEAGFDEFNAADHSWAREIPWLKSVTKMEIWIKGVLTAEDTLLAVESGCDGIIVSNHGKS